MYVYIYIYIYVIHTCQAMADMPGVSVTPGRPACSAGDPQVIRGNHLSNTTCLTQTFFNSGK